mmetsp:Transcript_12557/g.25611  ORF Transcript_12557/g.25611 Transcript_12557/m.25611 type:complete len:562 (+) Transcript_12557:152-1837(+)|eukprot:CAMPEP_0118639120 /NCGR_PEP_ID=MMETSP0785-20121206/4056_1 /TAXON_ID=91992 /ORGANISM="Bolidomonas pacifica, Strain CCMP 1866" /LENGTH=561 /DNA_ID=CAMNT_0006530431 /DNA_START=147 /DNA_END=1832 /DNA_ORIENTATION=+
MSPVSSKATTIGAVLLSVIVALVIPNDILNEFPRLLQSVSDYPSSESSLEVSRLTTEAIVISVHRNGEFEACHPTPYVIHPSLDLDGADFDSNLTDALLSFLEIESCGPVVGEGSFQDFCDMGELKTPKIQGLESVVRVPSTDSLPCSFFTREGRRITSLSSLATFASMSSKPALDIYAVAAGRLFQYAPGFVGEIFDLSHLPHPENKKMYLETMSVSPKVFDIHNFFILQEADDLIDRALNNKNQAMMLKRSSTGVGDEIDVNPVRTSENAFDTSGKSAMLLKKRCFKVLGIDPYNEEMADGLQVLRYNVSKAYKSHLDYLDRTPSSSHDFDSAGLGTNRYATILLYMVDFEPEDGGETVFTYGSPYKPVKEPPTFKEALEEARSYSTLFKENSWEEKMVAECKSSLSVTPKRARSVLFYSQHPDGRVDKKSQHGGCPVLTEEKSKWAANLWVWNGPRMGYATAPKKANHKKRRDRDRSELKEDSAPAGSLKATFRNTGQDPKFQGASLYYEDTLWGEFGPRKVHSVNSYVGHVWNVKDESGNVLLTWVIKDEGAQTFAV